MKKLVYVALALLVLAGCGNKSASEQRTLTISTWGLSEDLLVEDVYGPFEKEHNVKIVLDTGTTSERYTKLKNDPNSSVDIIELSQKAAADGYVDGLFEALDYSKIPNASDLIDGAKLISEKGFGPAYTVNSIGIIYDPAVLGFEIKEWSDLWKPELVGKVAIPEITSTFGPAIVAMAGDVAGTDVKADQGAAAFKALGDLKPNIVKTYAKSSDLAVMFSTGEIEVAVVGDFGYPIIKKVAPDAEYLVPESGTYANFNTLDINKNSKNKDLAYEFINYRLSAKLQEQNASPTKLNEAPVNAKAVLSGDDAQFKTYGDVAKRAKAIDYSVINPLMADWVDQYNRIMNQ